MPDVIHRRCNFDLALSNYLHCKNKQLSHLNNRLEYNSIKYLHCWLLVRYGVWIMYLISIADKGLVNSGLLSTACEFKVRGLISCELSAKEGSKYCIKHIKYIKDEQRRQQKTKEVINIMDKGLVNNGPLSTACEFKGSRLIPCEFSAKEGLKYCITHLRYLKDKETRRKK